VVVRRLGTKLSATPATAAEVRGLTFVLLFALAAALALSVPSRFAERYAFSAVFLIGAAGVVAAWIQWAGFRRAMERVDAAVPALPAIVWTTLALARAML
jgi:membrane associated rhomboid family serine protease